MKKRPDSRKRLRVRGRAHIASIGATRKREEVLSAAAMRRDLRAEAGVPLEAAPPPEERAKALLTKHRIPETPAALAVATLHFQLKHEIDCLFEQRIAKRRANVNSDARELASMVSAGKAMLACLSQLGLPGDVEDDFFSTMRPPTALKADQAKDPDSLEAWE